jgi:histidine triad (HIT) family protein
MTETDCLFCKFASGAIPVDKLHDDDLCIAIRDIQPLAPIHVLIIPKAHIATANDLTEDHAALLGRMFNVARRQAAADGIAERGYRLTFNVGPEGGQSMYHLHLHLLGGQQLGPSSGLT